MSFSVKQARHYAGYTQSEIAEKLGISRDSYRKIEKNPEIATVRIAKSRKFPSTKFFSSIILLKVGLENPHIRNLKEAIPDEAGRLDSSQKA